MSTHSFVEDVTCMGCGCLCDDITVIVGSGRIREARNACALGAAWFGDGIVPTRTVLDGVDASPEVAITAAAERLARAQRVLVYLAPNLSCEAQRAGAAIADFLHGILDTATTATARTPVLVSQERGQASATLGEIRNRADVVVFWSVDIDHRYPRFASRYAPQPNGLHVSGGRSVRRVISVDVGQATGPGDADHRITIDAADEVATLAVLRALASASEEERAHLGNREGTAWMNARKLAPLLLDARYGALVYDAEPDERASRSPSRFDALAALAQALNGATRYAAIALRAGGNRSGADAVLTAQTGYPMAVDFARGTPRYRPHDGSAVASLEHGAIDVVLVLGDATVLPPHVVHAMGSVSCVVIGPRASETSFGAAAVRIDTTVPGIHSSGIALRTDDVPLPLRPSLQGPQSAEVVLGRLARALRGPA
ncbi:MAG: formylmethanofuran dehydrogenase subunit [Geminicoccaceae bacterium]|nr:formylmethanofuran dehydrogenase subunit [Geminicoccaceae bacterium]